MIPSQLNWITNFIWGIADDVLRDVYLRGKYRDVILPMTVIRRLDVQDVDLPISDFETEILSNLEEQFLADEKDLELVSNDLT